MKREDLLLDALHTISNPHLSTGQRIQALLESGLRYFGMSYAFVSRIKDEDYFVRFLATDTPDKTTPETIRTSDTVCQFVLQAQDVVALKHIAETAYGASLATSPIPVQAYIGAPISTQKEPIGTLCFQDASPRQTEFDRHDEDVVRTLANWIGQQIECDRMHQDLDSILSTTSIFVMHKDQDNRILRANPSFDTLCHHDPNTNGSSGQLLSDILPEAAAKALSSGDEIIWQSGHAMEGETFKLPRADGTSVSLYGSRLPYLDPVSRDPCMMFVAVDISELTRREEELIALNDALVVQKRAVTELYRQTPAMMHSVNATAHILDVSDAWLRKLGYAREDVVGRSIFDFMTPQSSLYSQTEALPDFWRNGSSKDIAYQFVTSSGDIVEIELSAMVDREFTNHERRALAFLVDVTERNAAIRALEVANEDLRQFTSIASHDLQAPLRKIQSFSDVLSDALDAGDQSDINYALDVIRTSAERASCLVTDLLAFARISNKSLSIGAQPLTSLVGTALDTLSMQIEESQA